MMEPSIADDIHAGYTSEQWESMVSEGYGFLRERARLGRLTTYTEFCAVVSQRGVEAFIDVGSFGAMSGLLREIGILAIAETDSLLITSLITGLHNNISSDGFFAWAQTIKKLPVGELTSQVKETFWDQQVGMVFAAYHATPPGPFS